MTDVNVDIIQAGCAGSKIVVTPRTQSEDRVASEMHNGIRSWITPELIEKLDGAQIARAKGKYYLVSGHIQSRCGCGTSFSFEKKNVPVNLTKIHRLQNALKLSPNIQEIQERIRNYK